MATTSSRRPVVDLYLKCLMEAFHELNDENQAAFWISMGQRDPRLTNVRSHKPGKEVVESLLKGE